MKKTSSQQLRQPISNPLPILLLFLTASAAAMAAEPEKQAAPAAAAQEAAVHIVYVDRPEDAEPEEFHLRTLTPVLGSEQKARDAVLYHYKNAASGFSAKLTPQQVEDLKGQVGNRVFSRLCRARLTSYMVLVGLALARARHAPWALCECVV